MPVPAHASNQKWRFCLGETTSACCKIGGLRDPHRRATYACARPPSPKTPDPTRAGFKKRLLPLPPMILMLFAGITLGWTPFARAQEKPPSEEDYRREELGVNPYTAPSIVVIFRQLDELRPLPFKVLWRDFPHVSPIQREQKGLLFGGLIADGFLIVEAEKKDLIEDLGRILIREARGLGVADRLLRHSASLTELGRQSDWLEVRKELVATQADVEEALIALRDQKMAHLISLGGWLRGLEICAGAVEADFSPRRAKVLIEPGLIDYFLEELDTLSPTIARTPLFEKIRAGITRIRALVRTASVASLQLPQVRAIHAQAREINLAIRRTDKVSVLPERTSW